MEESGEVIQVDVGVASAVMSPRAFAEVLQHLGLTPQAVEQAIQAASEEARPAAPAPEPVDEVLARRRH